MIHFDSDSPLDQTHPALAYVHTEHEQCADLACLCGMLDHASPTSSLSKNLRSLDAYYQSKLTFEVDFDERYFINTEGRLRTPIKLISPMSFHGGVPHVLREMKQSPPPHQHKRVL